MIAAVDSGGPAFIDKQIAGIASYVTSLSRIGYFSDVDAKANSSFGEIGTWQRVSAFQTWIDQTLNPANTAPIPNFDPLSVYRFWNQVTGNPFTPAARPKPKV